MDQVTLGVNKLIKKFSLSNYSLTYQIILINFSTAFLAFIFLILFNCYLILTSKNLDSEQNNIKFKLQEITDHLSQNAIKRIFTFDDNCTRILREGENNIILIRQLISKRAVNNDGKNCNNKDYNLDYEVRIENKPPELDPTYTQQYVYSNFLNNSLNIKVIADNWFMDTNDFIDI